MTRLSLSAFACATVLVLSGVAAQAGEGGGGGGDDRWARPPIVNPGPRPAPNARPFAESTLPDGTRIRSTGLAQGLRRVTTTTPDNKVTGGNRGRKVGEKAKVNRTVYNPKTGITSTFTRTSDGRVTGVHVDRQGNRSVSRSNN